MYLLIKQGFIQSLYIGKTGNRKKRSQQTHINKQLMVDYSKNRSEYLYTTKTWHLEDATWKANQILKAIISNKIKPKSIVEVGCGAGGILKELKASLNDNSISIEGYDIAPDAIKMAKEKQDGISFYNVDFLEGNTKHYDLLLMIDVFEHVPNYIEFIKKCSQKAKYKIYHIPLDLHVSALLRNRLISGRESVGHLHYFTKETALATLVDTGQEIVDVFYTNAAFGTAHKTIKTKLANMLRAPLFFLFPNLTVKLIGGYSLLVLTK